MKAAAGEEFRRETPQEQRRRRELRFQLARLLRSSEHMLACAQGGDWESVEAMESERRSELENCFAHALEIDAAEEITEAIAALMHINEQLVQLVAEARARTGYSRRNLEIGRQASRAYLLSGEGV